MSEPTFQIVFRGKILSGFERDQVRSNLSQLFKTAPERIDVLLDAPKTVLKSGLSRDAAGRYQEVLRQAGIMVAVVSDAPIAVAVPAVSTPAPTSDALAPSEPSRPGTSAESGQTAAVTAIAESADGLSLAPPGATILPPQVRKPAEIDTSALSLAQPGVALIDKTPVPVPEFDLSGISLANDEGPIDRTPKAAAATIDVSALSLTEQPPEPEREPSALQKLLSASID
jgi:hypothetical protein